MINSQQIFHAIGAVSDAAILDAKSHSCPKARRRVKWGVLAACLCLTLLLAIPAMAAAIPAFYQALYEISPSTAQFFKPVQMACEDQGIRMEVVASYLHEDTAEIYIAMQDLEGDRLSASTDLLDSYSIHTPFDSSSRCALAGYDGETKTATFLIAVEQWNQQKLEGEKLTFSVRQLLGRKEAYTGTILDLDGVALNNAAQMVELRGLDGNLATDWEAGGMAQRLAALQPTAPLISPTDGVAVTGIGYLDGALHVQLYFEDILKTDNHGFVSLVHKETGERVESYGSLSFFDEAHAGSYTDFVFPDLPAEQLGQYELYGEFVTSSGSIQGNWSVTFPIQAMDTAAS